MRNEKACSLHGALLLGALGLRAGEDRYACKVALAAVVLPMTMACVVNYYTEWPAEPARVVHMEIEARRGWTDTGV